MKNTSESPLISIVIPHKDDMMFLKNLVNELAHQTLKNFEIIDQDGAKVLIDPKATMFLLGSVMDYRADKLSSRFVFDNPNEKSRCGCGESFSI